MPAFVRRFVSHATRDCCRQPAAVVVATPAGRTVCDCVCVYPTIDFWIHQHLDRRTRCVFLPYHDEGQLPTRYQPSQSVAARRRNSDTASVVYCIGGAAYGRNKWMYDSIIHSAAFPETAGCSGIWLNALCFIRTISGASPPPPPSEDTSLHAWTISKPSSL